MSYHIPSIDCPECSGRGHFLMPRTTPTCEHCNGTGRVQCQLTAVQEPDGSIHSASDEVKKHIDASAETSLDQLAEKLYNVTRAPGESDLELRDRCKTSGGRRGHVEGHICGCSSVEPSDALAAKARMAVDAWRTRYGDLCKRELSIGFDASVTRDPDTPLPAPTPLGAKRRAKLGPKAFADALKRVQVLVPVGWAQEWSGDRLHITAPGTDAMLKPQGMFVVFGAVPPEVLIYVARVYEAVDELMYWSPE